MHKAILAKRHPWQSQSQSQTKRWGSINSYERTLPHGAAVALALRYRARMLRIGIDDDYKLVASRTEPLLSFSGVQPGQTARIIIQAVNGSAQSVPSQPMEITMPLPIKETAKSSLSEPVLPVVAAPRTSATTSLNGNRNGHADVVSDRE
jgi:hypothetical protein